MRDPYQVLGIPSTATDEEVKKAYRNLPGNITQTITMTTPWRTWPKSG